MAEIREAERVCPRCGQDMEPGFVNGGRGPLRWFSRPDEHTTVIGGEQLVKLGFAQIGTYNMPAARCRHCRLGIFAYDE